MSTMSVAAGQTSTSLRISSGVDELVYGSALSSIILGGGTQMVLSGGFAGTAQVRAGGTEIVTSGGGDSGTIVSSGAKADVDGTALATTVGSAGALYVSSGGAVSKAVDKGEIEVSAGGLALSTTISSAGDEYVQGGIASGTVIARGGAEALTSGGLGYNETIRKGGAESAFGGGVVDLATVSSGGYLGIGPGGVASGASVLAGGAVQVSAGSAYTDIIAAGGTQSLAAGGLASGTIISGGGVEIVSAGGTQMGARISAGGVTLVLSGGTEAADTQVAASILTSAGLIIAVPGAVAAGRVTTTGALLLDPGSSAVYAADLARDKVIAGGGAYILSLGTATSLTLSGGDNEVAGASVYSGGQVLTDMVGSAGSLYVATGGVVSASTVASAGALTLSGGSAYQTVVDAGGVLNFAGGGGSGLTVQAGGLGFIAGAAIVSGVTDEGFVALFSAGLASAGTAYGVNVASGGRFYDDAGGDAAAVTVRGTAVVSRGGAASDVLISGGTLVLSAGADYGAGLAFTGSGGMLDLYAAPPAASISGFTAGDTIVLDTLAYDSATALSVPSAGVLNVGGSVTLNIAGATSPSQFSQVDDDGQTAITANGTACYAAGTRVLTPDGEVPIETLRPGDLVVTGGGVLPILWVGQRHIDLSRHAWPGRCAPMRICAGALGDGLPRRDLRVSPLHALYLAGALFEAISLIDGETIFQERQTRQVSYHHIELVRHGLIFAEGSLSESYRDTGNRWMFAPVAAPRGADPGVASCAPLVTGGAALAAVRARLLACIG